MLRVGGGWPNEGAVVRRFGRPAYTARTGIPGHDCEYSYTCMHRHTEPERDPICHIEPVTRRFNRGLCIAKCAHNV